MAHEVLLGAAFSAGIVVVFSPCATALLPAYLSYYLAREEDAAVREPDEPEWPRSFPIALAAIGLGLGILTIGLVDWVVSFGDRAASDASLGIGGGALAAGGAWNLHAARARIDPLAFARLWSRLGRGLRFGGAASLGIGGVYLGMGLVIRLGVSGLAAFLPWIAFATALIVVVLGLLMILGRPVFSYAVPVRGFRPKTVPGFVLFGAGYGLIASGCFLPVFLQVVVASLALALAEAVQVLLAYGLGSAAIFLLISLSAAAARGATIQRLRGIRRFVPRVAGAVVVVTGAYVLWYDWTFLLSRGL